MTDSSGAAPVSRRAFLTVLAAGVGGLGFAACTRGSPLRPTGPGADAIAAAEAVRPHTGRTVAHALTARRVDIDLGWPTVRTLAYGDTVPGAVLRAGVGDELAVTVGNDLDHAISLHWHGIAMRNDMDGAAPASPDIGAGGRFTYRFTVAHPGTYWAHPHVGLDTDHGLYLPVIVEDPHEHGDYDTEWIVVLDDWTDGIGPTPDQILADLRAAGMRMNGPAGMPGMSGRGAGHGQDRAGTSPGMMHPAGVGASDLLDSVAGDVAYPHYLINGRIPDAATTFATTPGARVRIRLINAAADTAFRVGLAGHAMTVTHTAGYPVVPVEVDALLIGMGERYDAVVTAGDGVFPLAAAEGKNASARALLRTGAGAVPDAGFRPRELGGRIATVAACTAAEAVALPAAAPEVTLAAVLGGAMLSYEWTINGRRYEHIEPLTVRHGDRARLTFTNTTRMWHPMHLHGHTFQVLGAGARPGPRKDTVIVAPGRSVSVDLVADNPGQWMRHCHNGYHQEAGMMTRLDYHT